MAIPACAPRRPPDVRPQAIIVFPPPPDSSRIQFLTRFSSALDLRKKRAGFKKLLLGEEPDWIDQPILKPYGIAIHQGRIYVCDTKLPGLEVLDLAERSFEYRRMTGLGALKKPINCFVDRATGHLYVADTERRQVVQYDEQGGFVDAMGNGPMKPSDVFVEGDSVWVSDMASRQIHVYDKTTRKLLFSFPGDQTRETPGTLFQPLNLYVRDDLVYVTDFGDFRVKVYSRTGEFIKAIGSYGTAPGQFVRPKGIAVDREHRLYVVDAGFENVQIFDREGRLLMFFGGKYEGPGNMWLPAKVIIDYDNTDHFQQYVDARFRLKYLILVTNQYGPDKISVYGFVEPREPTAGVR